MLRQLQAIFLAFVLLVPSGAQVSHQWQHTGDAHCSEKNTLHFHATEHHCSICDIQVSVADLTILSPFLTTAGSCIIPYYPGRPGPYTLSFFDWSGSRGPPLV